MQYKNIVYIFFFLISSSSGQHKTIQRSDITVTTMLSLQLLQYRYYICQYNLFHLGSIITEKVYIIDRNDIQAQQGKRRQKCLKNLNSFGILFTLLFIHYFLIQFNNENITQLGKRVYLDITIAHSNWKWLNFRISDCAFLLNTGKVYPQRP